MKTKITTHLIMLKFIAIAAVGSFLVGCSTTEQGAGYGGAGGSIIGGILGGWTGAAIGAAAGALGGSAVGALKENADAKKESK